MGIPRTPKPVKIFASIIYREEDTLRSVFAMLQDKVGEIQEQSMAMPFFHTDYYEKEMGKNLMRVFILFRELFQREQVPGIKLETNGIESALAENNKRIVNIDPGYISLENVILATTKGYAHRIYIGSGIYADLTLMYGKDTYRTLGWTYPDYGEPTTISIFNTWREDYKKVLRCQKV